MMFFHLLINTTKSLGMRRCLTRAHAAPYRPQELMYLPQGLSHCCHPITITTALQVPHQGPEAECAPWGSPNTLSGSLSVLPLCSVCSSFWWLIFTGLLERMKSFGFSIIKQNNYKNISQAVWLQPILLCSSEFPMPRQLLSELHSQRRSAFAVPDRWRCLSGALQQCLPQR